MKLSELVKQDTFTSSNQEAVLNVIVTCNWLLSEISETLGAYGVTHAQFNVLRVLKGSHPNLMTCGDISSRLLDRRPDVTRLLDRLEDQGFVRRERARHDRRIVQVGISERGLRVLKQIDGPINVLVKKLSGDLDADELSQLSRLLEKMRTCQR